MICHNVLLPKKSLNFWGAGPTPSGRKIAALWAVMCCSPKKSLVENSKISALQANCRPSGVKYPASKL